MAVKGTKLRFTIYDDIMLLREVIERNPYEDTSRWKSIRNHVVEVTSKNFSVRAIREHVDHLLKLYKKNDYLNLRKLATEEQYQEKRELIQQIADHMYTKNERENYFAQDNTISYDAEDNHIKVEIGEVNLEDIVPHNEIVHATTLDIENVNNFNENLNITSVIPNQKGSIPIRRNRNRLKNINYNYFQQKRDYENRLKERELDIEERRLAIEERRIQLDEHKFEVEKQERELRLEIELEERRHRIKIECQQQDIHNQLIQQLINK